MTEPDGWAPAVDARVVHDLLCASDAYAAARHDTPAPRRNPQTSARLVAQGSVQLLRRSGRPAAMFTLAGEPPFDPAEDFPPASRPVYLMRLAVDPATLATDPLLGVQCVRRAVEVARERGADAIRAETNPDLTAIMGLLTGFGFVPCEPARDGGPARRIYLQKQLTDDE